MDDNRMTKIGGTCSILAGVVFLISGLVYFLFLVGRFDWNSVSSISQYLQNVPLASTMWSVVNEGATLASFLAIAGVIALSDVLKPANEGFIRWTSTLAIIGYTILAVTNVADLYQTKHMAIGYAQLDKSAQAALEVIGIGTLDPVLSLRFITIGPWFLVAGWSSLRGGQLPKGLAYLGMVAGSVALLVVVAAFLELEALIPITAGMAVIFHPIWLIGTGIILRQRY